MTESTKQAKFKVGDRVSFDRNHPDVVNASWLGEIPSDPLIICGFSPNGNIQVVGTPGMLHPDWLKPWTLPTPRPLSDLEPTPPAAQPLPEPEPTSAQAKQVGGSHYKDMPNGYKPRDIIHALDLGWDEGNALKYLLRHRAKSGRQDLEKAIHYIELLIEREYEE